MMKLGFVVVALVGCGAKPAEPLEAPKVTAPITPNEMQLSRPAHVGPIHSLPPLQP